MLTISSQSSTEMTRRLPRLAKLLLLLGLGLAACTQNDYQPKRAVAPLPKDEVLLPADSSKRSYIQEQTVEPTSAPLMEPVAGKIAYDESRTARISSPIPGRVISTLPELGSTVKANDPLVELDSPALGQAKADYANAVADQRLAEEAYRRAKMLYENDVLPRKELQQTEDNLARTRNEAQRARMHLHNLGVADDRINDRYVVRTPIAGVITERHVNPGMEVRPDLAEPLFVVSDLRSLWVLMNVFEKDLGLIHPGTQVWVEFPWRPGRRGPDPSRHAGMGECAGLP
jgi:cobalt-zinc-cadmium efflux system membrane fusion protein